MNKPLTPLTIANLKPRSDRYEKSDPGCRGLRVVVFPSGHKSFIARYRFKGLPCKLTLGSCIAERDVAESDAAPELDTPLSLAAARSLCAEKLRQAKGGKTNPAAEKRQKRQQQHAAKAASFAAVAEEFLRREGPRLRTLGQRKADLGLLFAALGQQPIEQITRAQFVRQFDFIEDQRGPVRANRAMMAVKRLLNWHSGRVDNYISVLTRTPARISISRRARSHVPSDTELQAIVLAAERDEGIFGRYLLFTLLTACRRGESAGLRRSELSPDGRTWVIPGSRYKNGRDCLVPLSTKAQAIIQSMPVRAGGDYVFDEKSNGKSPLRSFAFSKAKLEVASGTRGWRIHDTRRAARTLLSRAGIAADISEMCLGHSLSGVRATYDRWSFEAEKRHAFEALARMVEDIARPPADTSVVPIGSAKGRRK
jgi:integrase